MPRGRSRYLRDRASRRGDYRRRMYEQPRMDYRDDYAEYDSRGDFRQDYDRRKNQDYHMDYERPRESSRMYDYDMRDYRGDYRGDYRRDYREDYSEDRYEEDYKKDLKEWTNKLKKYDRFGLGKEQAISKAKEMGVTFDEYEEDEFYAIFLMHISDYPQIANDPHTYLQMAKSWLEDKDLKIEPSEKVCKYLYEIVMAEE